MYRQGRRIDGIDVVDGDLPGTPGLAEAVQKMADIAREEEESFAWIGLSQPTIEEIELMGQMFGLEHLYLEDSLNPHQPTKLDPQTDYDFIVMKILTYLDSTSDVETGQISVFIGEWFIVTIRLGPLGELGTVRQALEAKPKLLAHGPATVLHAIMDRLVDRYVEVADEINTDIELLEAEIFTISSATSNMAYYSVNGPTKSLLMVGIMRPNVTAGTGQQGSVLSTYDGGQAITSASTAAPLPVRMNAVATFTADGTFAVRQINTTGGAAVTAKAGSWARLTRLA